MLSICIWDKASSFLQINQQYFTNYVPFEESMDSDRSDIILKIL